MIMGSTFFSERESGDRIRTARNRKKRPKTFKSEESAKKYADSIKAKGYDLVNLKSPEAKHKKLKVVIKA